MFSWRDVGTVLNTKTKQYLAPAQRDVMMEVTVGTKKMLKMKLAVRDEQTVTGGMSSDVT